MGDLVPFSPVKRTIRRLAKREIEAMQESYRLSAGYQDPMPTTDINLLEMFHLGMVEDLWMPPGG